MERHPLLQSFHALLRARRFPPPAEAAYLNWARDFLDFFADRDPRGMRGREISEFLDYLRRQRRYDLATLAEVGAAIALLLGQSAHPEAGQRLPAQTPRYEPQRSGLPDRREVVRLLTRTHEAPGLIARLIYATGMRLVECLALRIADIDLQSLRIAIRSPGGERDRSVPLPRALAADLDAQILRVRATHRADLDAGRGYAPPKTAPRGRRGAGRTLAWQYVFPARLPAIDPNSGCAYRRQLEPVLIEQAIAEAASRAGLSQQVDSQVLRRCFALRMLEDGHDIETIRRLLGGDDPRRLITVARGAAHERIEEASPAYHDGPPAKCANDHLWLMP